MLIFFSLQNSKIIVLKTVSRWIFDETFYKRLFFPFSGHSEMLQISEKHEVIYSNLFVSMKHFSLREVAGCYPLFLSCKLNASY